MKLVIFDCDGVLVDSEPVVCRVMASVLTEAGFPMAETDIHAFIGGAAAETRAAIEARFGKPLPADIRERTNAALRLCLADGFSPMPGVVEVIEALGTSFCVASNSSHDYLRLMLGTAGLFDRFGNRVFSSYDVARPKPHPDLFLHAAERLSAAPGDCVVIEDSVHGVRAGVAAGMRVIGFTGGGHCAPDHGARLIAAGAGAVCARMTEVAERLGAEGCLRAA